MKKGSLDLIITNLLHAINDNSLKYVLIWQPQPKKASAVVTDMPKIRFKVLNK